MQPSREAYIWTLFDAFSGTWVRRRGLKLPLRLSWLAFKALDVYIGVVSHGRVPAQRAWYLANASGPPLDRGIPHAEDWCYYTDLLSIGQREASDEWTVDPLSRLPQQAHIALRRVDRILGHLPMTDLGVMIGALGSLPDGQDP